MKLKFKRKWIDHPTGGKIHHQIFSDESLRILVDYIGDEIGRAGYENHLEAIRKIRNDEITDWGDGGNCCGSSVKKDGVIIEHDYIYPPESNILNLSLDQFEKAIIGWKTFVEDKSLMEYEIDI
jgi:hypothetical protein